MQKVIHCCDICFKETSWQKEPIKGYGFVAHHLLDWVFLPSPEGERLVCSPCNTILRRARELQIELRPPSDTISIGVYTPGVAPDWPTIYTEGRFVSDAHPSISIPPTDESDQ